MIVREEGGALVLVRQVDHSELAGEAALQLAEPAPPASALVAAARVHDNGWREADEAPTWNPRTRRPHTFRDFPAAPYRAIWRRGIGRAIELDPRVGLLVLLHGGRFFRADADDPRDRAFRDALDAQCSDLLRRAGLEGSLERAPPEVERQFEWVRFLDALSLVACGGYDWARRPQVDGVRYDIEGPPNELRVAPWPFREPFSLEVETRRVRGTAFSGEAEMRDALLRAQPRVERVRVAPG